MAQLIPGVGIVGGKETLLMPGAGPVKGQRTIAIMFYNWVWSMYEAVRKQRHAN